MYVSVLFCGILYNVMLYMYIYRVRTVTGTHAKSRQTVTRLQYFADCGATVTRLCTVFFIYVFGVTKKQNKFLDSGSYKSFPHDCYFKLLYVFVFSRMMQHRFHLAKGYYHYTGSAIIG